MDFASGLSQFFIDQYSQRRSIVIVDVISCMLLVYDYILTFPLELDVIWSTSSSSSSSAAFGSSSLPPPPTAPITILQPALPYYSTPTAPTFELNNITHDGRTRYAQDQNQNQNQHRQHWEPNTTPTPPPHIPICIPIPISTSISPSSSSHHGILRGRRSKGNRKRSGSASGYRQWYTQLRKRWNTSKVLFVLARYPVFVGCALEVLFETQLNTSFDWCRGLLGGIVVTRALGFAVAECIFTLRTLALFSNARKMVFALVATYILFFGTVIIMFGLFIGLSRGLSTFELSVLPTDYPGCVLIAYPPVNLVLISFSMVMVYEAVLAAIVMYPVYQSYREGHSYSSLLNVIYQDAILFYLILFVVSLANVLTIVFPNKISYSLAHFQLVIHSILACRSMMHIRAEVKIRVDNDPGSIIVDE